MINDEVSKMCVELLNKALSMEYAAAIQYGTHAEQVVGIYSGPIMTLLKDSGNDELKHAETLRGIISDYFKEVPGIIVAPIVSSSDNVEEIITKNIISEKEAVSVYKEILNHLTEYRSEIEDIYERVEHDIRHILMEEQEHIVELERLLS